VAVAGMRAIGRFWRFPGRWLRRLEPGGVWA